MENPGWLRVQRAGKQVPWTLEELKAGLEKFFSEFGRYPTAHEVDRYEYLPSARSVERRFSGLVSLRQKLSLAGQDDFRAGEHSAERARKINKRAHYNEKQVYDFLTARFGIEFVHREFFFTDDKRTRADFFVYDSKEGFCVDVFYPESARNLTGCLNSKLDKYLAEYMRQYPVVFLQMNEAINQGTLDKITLNKKKKLLPGQFLLSWNTFRAFCEGRSPRYKDLTLPVDKL